MFSQLNIRLKRTLILTLGLGVLGAGMLTGEWITRGEQTLVLEEEYVYEATDGTPEQEPAEPQEIAVHVTGQVKEPGLYYLPAGSRVDEAVRKAGPTGEAGLDGLNLAAPLSDGQKIYVPDLEEAEEMLAQAAAGGEGAGDGRINVNTASRDQLQNLPGVGPVTADKIIRHREQMGPFVDVEDLLQVDGIGPARLDEMRSRVSLY